MSSRPLLIAQIVGAALAGLTLLGVALAVVAVEGASLSPPVMTVLVLGAAAGWVLAGTVMTWALDRLINPQPPSDDQPDDGPGGGSGGEPDPPPRPSPTPDWWSELERELASELETRERVLVG